MDMGISPLLSPTTIRPKQATSLPVFDWELSPERSILLICKLSNPVIETLFCLARRLLLEPRANCRHIAWRVHVEEAIFPHPLSLQLQCDLKARGSYTGASSLHAWPTPNEFKAAHAHLPDIDLIVSLGGDGTVLHSAWQFQSARVPPILPVYVHGSLGFLTVFDMGSCYSLIDSAACCSCDLKTNSPLFINYRMRLRCTIVRSLHNRKSTLMHEQPSLYSDVEALRKHGPVVPPEHPAGLNDGQLSSAFVCTESFHVLNELVVDRGPSPFMTVLELYGDNRHLTTVQADGLVIATPTGSTAYSLSAGGSIVDPSVPAILITPICAHTLSFRPLHLRDNMEIKVLIPTDARHTVWASFDGRHRVELQRGDYIIVSVSNYPVPTLCSKDQTLEWFESLQRCLQWNERKRQE